MEYCKLYASSNSDIGISAITLNRSIASLEFQNPSFYGKEFIEFSVQNGFNQVLWFSRLSVLEKHQYKGEGTFLMNHICEICDCEKLWIVNAPNAYRSRDTRKLHKFYKRFGFEPSLVESLLIRKPLVL